MMKTFKLFTGLVCGLFSSFCIDAVALTISIPKASGVGCPTYTDQTGMCLTKECSVESQGHFVFAAQDGTQKAHGIKFCTVYVDSWRKNTTKQSHSTWYAALPGDSAAPRCVWLCENGWGGKECSEQLSSSSTKMCDPQAISSALYSVMSVGADSEDNIYTGDGWPDIHDCNDTQFKQRAADRDQEHEVTYGVINWLPSGHGARVGPIVARAFCGRNKTKGDCRMIITPVGGPDQVQVLCMPGHKLNSAGTDCVVADGYQDVCGYTTDCAGWSANDFASSDYVRITKDGCYQYRCAKPEHGFAGSPKTNRECMECPTGMRKGVSQIDGECVAAGAGYMFNPNAESKATEITQAKALYSKDFLKMDSNKGVPCWMSAEGPDDFKACLTTGATDTTSTSTSTSTSNAETITTASTTNTGVSTAGNAIGKKDVPSTAVGGGKLPKKYI